MREKVIFEKKMVEILFRIDEKHLSIVKKTHEFHSNKVYK